MCSSGVPVPRVQGVRALGKPGGIQQVMVVEKAPEGILIILIMAEEGGGL